MSQATSQIQNKEERRSQIMRLKEAINAERLLSTLGFDISRSTIDEVRAPCKVHGGDNKTSFRMSKQTKNWMCFSHGCHEEVGYDVISLVRHMLNLSFSDAIKYLENVAGININDESSYITYKRNKDREDFIKQAADNRQVPSVLLNEDYFKSFKRFRSDHFEKEGFPPEILDEFEVGGGYVDKYGFQRDVIPIRDKDGVLKAYSCRDITGKADYAYKYLLTKGFDKDKVLYNLHRAKQYMDEKKILIIVEGFKAVWRCHMAGYKNTVACMGSRITTGQQNLLYSNAFTIILLLDGDDAGMLGTVRAVKDMKGKINIIPKFFPYPDKDPGDVNIEELKSIIGGSNG